MDYCDGVNKYPQLKRNYQKFSHQLTWLDVEVSYTTSHLV
jgi:hypothetical protein